MSLTDTFLDQSGLPLDNKTPLLRLEVRVERNSDSAELAQAVTNHVIIEPPAGAVIIPTVSISDTAVPDSKILEVDCRTCALRGTYVIHFDPAAFRARAEAADAHAGAIDAFWNEHPYVLRTRGHCPHPILISTPALTEFNPAVSILYSEPITTPRPFVIRAVAERRAIPGPSITARTHVAAIFSPTELRLELLSAFETFPVLDIQESVSGATTYRPDICPLMTPIRLTKDDFARVHYHFLSQQTHASHIIWPPVTSRRLPSETFDGPTPKRLPQTPTAAEAQVLTALRATALSNWRAELLCDCAGSPEVKQALAQIDRALAQENNSLMKTLPEPTDLLSDLCALPQSPSMPRLCTYKLTTMCRWLGRDK